jgi:hypothetical protein
METASIRSGIGRRSRHSWTIRSILTSLLVFSAPALLAQEQTVQNDSVTDFSQVAIQVGFVQDERAAAWLTSPCNGDIVAVQIFWASFLGGAPTTIGHSITISEAATFPTPGVPLELLPAPLLTDGFLNEYRFLDKNSTVPLEVPVAQGQTFVVSFQFEDTPPPLGPSVTTDTNGCQAGRNGIFAIPPSQWFSACALGVSGDFVIRAVVSCDVVDQMPIFLDGFESGDTTAWTAAVP